MYARAYDYTYTLYTTYVSMCRHIMYYLCTYKHNIHTYIRTYTASATCTHTYVRICTTTNLRNLNGITKVKYGLPISNSWITNVTVVTVKSNLKQITYMMQLLPCKYTTCTFAKYVQYTHCKT